jgi:7-carboxy-7-deazaguanine synthase
MSAHHARAAAAEQLRVTEIFHSLQGGAASVGIRRCSCANGCPLRCRYCDTEYAFYGGEWHSIDEVLTEVARHGARYVCVTGGEPLAQPNCATLLARLCEADYRVSLETSGAMDIGGLDPRVVRVMDWKTPGSGEQARNRLENLGRSRRTIR